MQTNAPSLLSRWKSWLLISLIPILWSVCASAYVLHTPENRRTQLDTDGHIEYTVFLKQTGSLPVGGSFFEAHQPPLYYGISQLFSPGSETHERNVRLVSVVYGLLTLTILIYLLRLLKVQMHVATLVTLITATTPSFLYVFTSYTNDALATLLAAASLTVAYRICTHATGRSLVLILASCLSLLLYTKLSGAFLYIGLGLAVAILLQQKLIGLQQVKSIALAMGVGVLALTPWLYHNVTTIGSLTYSGFAAEVDRSQHISKSPAAFVLTPPGVTSHEWQTPYTWSGTQPHYWAKQNFLASLYSSSLFGTYSLMPMVGIAWYIFWFHTLLLVRIARKFTLSRELLFSLAIIVGSTLAQAIFVWRWPYTCHADFRLQLWSILPLAYVLAVTLTKGGDTKRLKLSPYALFLAAGLVASQLTYLWHLLTTHP